VFEVWWSFTKEMTNMKKLLTIFLLLFSINGHCEWTKLVDNDETSSYIDKTTIKKNGSFVKVWELLDYKTPQELNSGKYKSSVILFEYDCKDERRRILSLVEYTEQMGIGKQILTIDDPDKWSYVKPNTMQFLLMKSLCSR